MQVFIMQAFQLEAIDTSEYFHNVVEVFQNTANPGKAFLFQDLSKHEDDYSMK